MENIPVGTAISILGLSFTAWAVVVAWGIGVIRKEVGEIKDQAKATADAQILHVNQTERRLTMLETEFSFLRRKVKAGEDE